MLRYSGERLARVQASSQFAHGRFRNPSGLGADLNGNMLEIMREFVFGAGARRPQAKIPLVDPRPTWAVPPASGWRVTWFGHSALLLEIAGARILIDPMFGPRASPAPVFGTRWHAPPLSIAELPPIDLVLMSHDHYDHFDAGSVRQLAHRDIPVLTSLGVGARFESHGWKRSLVHELDWWERYTVPEHDIEIIATPAQHFSGRGAFDRNRTLWSSFVIRGAGTTIFFSADTGVMPELRTIGERFGPFDLTMLEIGAWDRRWDHIHLGPHHAMEALTMLGGGTLLPIHWSTFDLGLHYWSEPAETLTGLVAETGATRDGRAVRLLTPRIGAPVEPASADASAQDRWWREVR